MWLVVVSELGQLDLQRQRRRRTRRRDNPCILEHAPLAGARPRLQLDRRQHLARRGIERELRRLQVSRPTRRRRLLGSEVIEHVVADDDHADEHTGGVNRNLLRLSDDICGDSPGKFVSREMRG